MVLLSFSVGQEIANFNYSFYKFYFLKIKIDYYKYFASYPDGILVKIKSIFNSF